MARWFLLVLPFALVGCGLDSGGTGDGIRIHADSSTIEDTEIADTLVEDTLVEPAETSLLFDALDIDAMPETPLPGCTAEKHDGHDYLFCELDANWDQARTACQLAGLDLAIVNDKAEHDWIVGKLKAKSKSEWHIGLTDRDDEGTFKWVDGSSASFTSWASWEPNDWLWAEDCVITKKDGAWNDTKCTDGPHEAFICETR